MFGMSERLESRISRLQTTPDIAHPYGTNISPPSRDAKSVKKEIKQTQYRPPPPLDTSDSSQIQKPLSSKPKAEESYNGKQSLEVPPSPRSIIKVMTDPLDALLSPSPFGSVELRRTSSREELVFVSKSNNKEDNLSNEDDSKHNNKMSIDGMLNREPTPGISTTKKKRSDSGGDSSSSPAKMQKTASKSSPKRSSKINESTESSSKRKSEVTKKRSDEESSSQGKSDTDGAEKKSIDKKTPRVEKSKKEQESKSSDTKKDKKKKQSGESTSESLLDEAKKLKHLADKTKAYDLSEALEYYIGAGLKFLEYSHALEISQEGHDKARSMYRETSHYFENISQICLEGKNKPFAALCYKCQATSLARSLLGKHDRVRQLKEEIGHQLEYQSKNAHTNASSTTGHSPGGTNSNSNQPSPSEQTSSSPASSSHSPNGIFSAPNVSNQKQATLLRDADELTRCFEAIYRAEKGNESLFDVTGLIDHVKQKLHSSSKLG